MFLKTNSPSKCHKKYMKNSEENLHADIGDQRVNKSASHPKEADNREI